MATQEAANVTRHRGIGCERQPQRGEPGPRCLLRDLVGGRQRQEAVQEHPLDLVASHRDAAGAGEQSRASALVRDDGLFGSVGGEQPFFGSPRRLYDRGPHRRVGRPLDARLVECEHGQGRVHVVASQHEVTANGHALEPVLIRLTALLGTNAHQRQVGRSTADVDDENQLGIAQLRFEVFGVGTEVVIERGLRLLDQANLAQAGFGSGVGRQLAGALIERGGDGDDHVLAGQRRVGVAVLPHLSKVLEVGHLRLEGRDVGFVLPGSSTGESAHAG